jgi:hypothetical protein
MRDEERSVEADLDLREGLRQMATVLHGQQSAAVVLDLVTVLAQRTLRHADGVSFSLKTPTGYATASALPNEIVAMDRAQHESGRGPCVDAVDLGRRVESVLEESVELWPEFVAAARELGYEQFMAVPLTAASFADLPTLGALNIYSKSRSPFDDEQRQAASSFAQSADGVLRNADAFEQAAVENRQLAVALESRGVIGEAKGILMARMGCTSDAAFDELRRISRSTNKKLRLVAQDVIDSVTTRSSDGSDGHD